MKRIRQHVLSAVVALTFVALALGSAKSGSEGGGTTGNRGENATATPPQATAEPARTYEEVSVTTLLSDYKANEVRGDNRWKDHWVEVSGVVNDVKKNAFDSIYVVLGTGAQFELQTVHCQFPDKRSSQAANLSKGEKVVIRGRVKGMILSSVMVDDAEVAPSRQPPQKK